MVDTKEAIEVDVDTKQSLACEEWVISCPNSATWLVRWSCGCGDSRVHLCEGCVKWYKEAFAEASISGHRKTPICSHCDESIALESIKFVRI
jgi:hypothetical protein